MPLLTVTVPRAIERKLLAAARRRGEDPLMLARRALERGLAEPGVAGMGKRSSAMAEKAWDAEIRARVKAVDEGRVAGIPYEEVKKEMTARFGR